MEIRQNLQSVSQQDLPNPAIPPPSLQPGSKTAGLVSSAPVIGLDPTSSTGDPQPMVSTGQPPSPTSTKPSSPTVNLPSQSAQGTSTKLATGPPLSFSAAYLPSYPASEPSAVTSTAAPDGTCNCRSKLVSQLTNGQLNSKCDDTKAYVDLYRFIKKTGNQHHITVYGNESQQCLQSKTVN